MPDGQPSMLGEYALVELIGRGGMGEVWRAERTVNAGVRRRAAIKRILPQFQRDPVLRERFLAEARTTARLEHPNIVQVLDFADEPEPYLVLEYVEGISLGDLLKQAALGQAALPIPAALYIVAEAADALDYAHRRTDDAQRPLGIVHRDVSPPNILLSFDGVVKVNDFGVARAVDNIVRTQAGLTVGKIVYSAPEQARGETVDKRADVFSLGVVLWEMLTLRPLVPRNQPPAVVLEMLRVCAFPPPSSVNRAVRPDIDAIARDALAATADKRTPSAGRLANALRVALSTLAPGFDQRELARIVRAAAPERAARAGTEVGSAGGGGSGSALEASAVASSGLAGGRSSHPDAVPRASRVPGAPTMLQGSPMPTPSAASPSAPRTSSPPPPQRDSIPRTAESPMNPPFGAFAPTAKSQPPPAASPVKQMPSRPPPASSPAHQAPARPAFASSSPGISGPFAPIPAARAAPPVAGASVVAASTATRSRKGIVIAIVLVLVAIVATATWYYFTEPVDEVEPTTNS